MFKSIRWTLQLWHAGILTVALVGLGTALYLGASHGVRRELDVDLQASARTVVGRLLGPPHHGPWHPRPPRTPAEDGDDVRPDGPDDELDGGLFSMLAMVDRWSSLAPATRPEWVEHGAPPDWGDRVSRSFLRRPGVDDRDQPYFVIFAADGTVVQASSPEAASAVRPPPARPGGRREGPWEGETAFRTVAGGREALAPLPFGGTVVVGRSTDRLPGRLALLRWVLVGAGGTVLAIGLAGGWVLAGRVLRPVRAISDAAAAISTSDLSRRIPVDDTRSELGSLARTLNDTFDRLQQAYDRQVRFTADASHELRTPLAVIHSHTTLALRRDRSADEYRQTIETCARASRRMKELVDALLTLAAVDAGRLGLRKAPVDLCEVARECAALLRPLARERHVELAVECLTTTVNGDHTRLTQLVTNLLGNAIRYNHDGGRATVTVAPDAATGGAVLTVADSGVGIAAEDQPHLFERFFRADKARSRDVGGSGLGLAICHGIVQAHGGTLSLASEVGRGTTVSVHLPA